MDVIIDSDCILSGESQILPSQGMVELNLLASLGYSATHPPLAELVRRYHHLDGEWLIVSPIHWEATHNNAMIVACNKELQLSEDEAKHWFRLFSEHLAADGIELYYHNAEIWLLSAKDKPVLNAKPVHQILQHPLMPELAELDMTMYWQKFFTESQMFFASHPNQSALNGVWVWGDAPLKDQSISICTDENHLALAKIGSSDVTLYDPSVTLNTFQIVLLTDFETLSEHHQHELKKISARWYWNDKAYSSNDFNWLTRLWRTLTHAH